ncbi:hypothetical protein KFK09_010218 [Dendrobium nobile]|uniref:Uncharacterized protein n=1 Tax=Dendrobium nobile TaxID=94219 RepID=A0A8T3BNR3_DENNO|nr:hypothetical protein KFK09_010218 [Dendrobium nobile]
MYSLRPILSTTKGPIFPLHISRSVMPHLIRRPPLGFQQAIVNTQSRPKSASVGSALSSPPTTSTLRADTGGSTSDESIVWEERIEKGIYRCRFLAFLGVLGSLMGSVLCYLKGCVHVMDSFADYFNNGGRVIFMLVEALDIYLIGTVMLVFGMGLYELFISNFDVAKTSSHGSSLIGLFKLPARPKWLEIKSVSELKTKVGHAIVLVLLIGLFDKSRKVTICSPKDLLFFAVSILLSSGCLYLLSQLQTST